jgi:carboxypeptidase Q
VRFHGPVLALIAIVAQATPIADPASLQQIRREGLEHSQVMRPFDQFVTVIGPRLTGSPAHKTAAEWARQTLTSWGLSDARLEPWQFGRGWVLDHEVIEMVEPRYMPLIGYAEAWSASTSGVIEAKPVSVAGKTAAEITGMSGALKGAIVLTQPLQNEFVRADRPQPSSSEAPVRIGAPPMPRNGAAGDARAIAQALHDAGAGVLLRASAGEHGTVFVLGTDRGENAMPSMVLAAEHYNMIARMLGQGVAVKLRVGITARYLTSDTNSYNVVADLPGTDPVLENDVVLLGGHLDSWHTGTGASDNADGAAAVMEAMRILKATGLQPRRTIRVALWSGEEEGLLGSKAYVAQHLAGTARERISVYFNIDPGMGPIYGWYSEDSPAAKTLFDAWLAPLRDLDARKNVIAGITNTDHLSFKAAGVPGFTPIQDYVTYDVRTHHTNVDTYERVREQDLKQNAVTLAWFAYNAAMMGEPFPK